MRFTLDGVNVNPAWGPDVEKVYELENDRMLYRERLNGNLIWARGDEKKVRYQDLEHEFTILVERMLDTGLYESYISGVFTKADKGFNEDRGLARGPIRSIDKYEKLLAALDREFDLISDLSPEVFEVTYKKQPLLQAVFPNYPVMFNMVGTTFWVTEIGAYDTASLVDYGFAPYNTRRGFIPGSGDMTPDVSGGYYQFGTFGGADHWRRDDDVYGIKRTPLGPSNFRWRLYLVADDSTVYQLPLNQHLFIQETTFTGSQVLQGFADPEQECRFFETDLYQRLLTDEPDIEGVPTLPVPEPDVADLTFGYERYFDPAAYLASNLFVEFFASDQHQEGATAFGKFDSDAVHFPGEYFRGFSQAESPFGPIKIYPLLKDEWQEWSAWIYRTIAPQTEYQTTGATDVLNKNSYRLGDVIKRLLEEIDPTILFDLTPEYSQLLFDATNPVTGEANLTHFITPKSNVIVFNYDNAATRAPITFGAVESLLAFGMEAYGFIDEQNRYRIEHVSWFKNGGSYYGQVISVDLTTHIVPQLQRPWAYHTKEYRYKKELLPERVTFGWMDDVSDPFEGYPIEMLSAFVQKGNAPDKKIVLFTPDIDYIQAVPDQINKDGFVPLAAELVDDIWRVQFSMVEIAGVPDQNIQNGFWSFVYLHDRFHRHNMPSKRVMINGVQTSATTTRRAKELDIVFPAGIEPPPQELIVTGLGVAEIESMAINMNTRKATLKVLVDLDFDNPCPCEGYFREASYLMPIGADEDDLSDVTITSVLVNGQEYIESAVSLDNDISVVDIGGQDWVTNLADAINSLGIPNVTSPYPEAGDFANPMTDPSRICRLRFPECADIQITIIRGTGDGAYTPGEDTGLSVRWLEDGHERLSGDAWVNADLLAPFYSFVWADQPRIAQIYVPCL